MNKTNLRMIGHHAWVANRQGIHICRSLVCWYTCLRIHHLVHLFHGTECTRQYLQHSRKEEIISNDTILLTTNKQQHSRAECDQTRLSYLYPWWTGIAYWLEHQIRDRKVVGSNPGRSCRLIFFSIVNIVCWLLFGVCSTPVLPQWHVKDPGHSAKSAGGRLHLNMHTSWPNEVRVGWLCHCTGIVWEPIRKQAHMQFIRKHSVTVVSAHWATIDWSWPKKWN